MGPGTGKTRVSPSVVTVCGEVSSVGTGTVFVSQTRLPPVNVATIPPGNAVTDGVGAGFGPVGAVTGVVRAEAMVEVTTEPSGFVMVVNTGLGPPGAPPGAMVEVTVLPSGFVIVVVIGPGFPGAPPGATMVEVTVLPSGFVIVVKTGPEFPGPPPGATMVEVTILPSGFVMVVRTGAVLGGPVSGPVGRGGRVPGSPGDARQVPSGWQVLPKLQHPSAPGYHSKQPVNPVFFNKRSCKQN